MNTTPDPQDVQFLSRLAEIQKQQMQPGSNDQNFSRFFNEDASLMRNAFSSGEGVNQLVPDMTDRTIAEVIKYAASISDGKGFFVIPAPTSN